MIFPKDTLGSEKKVFVMHIYVASFFSLEKSPVRSVLIHQVQISSVAKTHTQRETPGSISTSTQPLTKQKFFG